MLVSLKLCIMDTTQLIGKPLRWLIQRALQGHVVDQAAAIQEAKGFT